MDPASLTAVSLPGWAAYVGVAALALGLGALLVGLVPRHRTRSAEDVVRDYVRSGTGRPVGPDADQRQVRERATDAAAELLSRQRTLEARIALRLEASGSGLKPAEWLVAHVAVVVLAGLAGLLLGAGDPVVLLLAVALGLVVPWLVLRVRSNRRRTRFGAALPETLQMLAGAIAAGQSLMQAVDTVAAEGIDPVAGEFRRALVETRLGVALEDALEGVAVRFASEDLAWVVMAIRIQRQVGGNLAELLERVAGTMREREYLRRQVSALSAEGRLSAVVLGALPVLFALYLLVAQRDYVMVLFTDPRGLVLVGFGAALLVLGIFWMSRLVKVEV
ncbi:type II secretion system F family protein [Nocardioides bruguierae]|uniref:Type II secretion system F family protein n=1 Tax=Nocardioides bruguierae TaxID=2945102 RepID=A0A9X2D9K2_9ACTN|nr:type II secretion system F family protein [Nocardioides bruguierae]MCM0621665.1 type II secretion system F family protein [Nocardioides bruguierae]